MHQDERIKQVLHTITRVMKLAREDMSIERLTIDQCIAITAIVENKENTQDLIDYSPNWGRGI